jgi:hypothetical protein
MAEVFEEPISQAFARGYEGVVDLIRKGRGHLLWNWLALIFLKIHLKHRDLRWHLNCNQGDARMSEAYDWTQLHHVHCVARSFHTGATIDPRVYGSLFVWPASNSEGGEEFDFANLLLGASLLLRIGPTFVFAVMNDSGFALGSLNETIEKITGPLTRIQGRELLANLCHRNVSIEPRPQYHSEINLWTGEYNIKAEISDEVGLNENPRPELYGEIMAFLSKDLLEAAGTDPQTLKYIREGRYTFLFGEDGKFLAH